MRLQGHFPQIPHKQAQATAACQGVIGNIDGVDNGFGIDVFCSKVTYHYLPSDGFDLLVRATLGFPFYTTMLSLPGGFFCPENRSD